jgi:vacuolar-type H+-ATPase subunit H
VTTDTITKIKEAERQAAAAIERARLDGTEAIRLAQSQSEARIKEESEKLRQKYDAEVAAAENEAASAFNEDEIASYSDAEKFTKSSSERIPDAVRFIVGGIIGKWQ